MPKDYDFPYRYFVVVIHTDEIDPHLHLDKDAYVEMYGPYFNEHIARAESNKYSHAAIITITNTFSI